MCTFLYNTMISQSSQHAKRVPTAVSQSVFSQKNIKFKNLFNIYSLYHIHRVCTAAGSYRECYTHSIQYLLLYNAYYSIQNVLLQSVYTAVESSHREYIQQYVRIQAEYFLQKKCGRLHREYVYTVYILTESIYIYVRNTLVMYRESTLSLCCVQQSK